MGEHNAIAHLFLVSTIGSATVVFLLEREPGLVEFPRIEIDTSDLDDEAALVQRIREQTGMEVAISGFLDHPLDGVASAVAKLVLARHLGGAPRVSLPHVGWEWMPGSQLLSLPFGPKMMLDELKAFMDD